MREKSYPLFKVSFNMILKILTPKFQQKKFDPYENSPVSDTVLK